MAEGGGWAAGHFAHHVTRLRYEDLPDETVTAAKTFILDTLGVGVAGAIADGASGLLSAARGWGGDEQATVWGRATRVPAGTAALINGFQVHCQEFDCLHEPAVVHVMATLLPAAIAQSERMGGLCGRDLIAAVVAGIDVAVTLGLAAKSGLRFFRPATAGGFGAVAAVGRLSGFDVPTLMNAFGIQYAQTSGTMQPHLEASVVLPMQVGFNARAAIQSCDLAAAGIAGPREVFEGRFGYLPLFEGEYELGAVHAELGRVWRVTELSHKPWPAGRATHGGIEGILSLREAHRFAAADVTSVRVIAPPLINRLCGRPDIAAPNANYARLCIPFAGANAMLHSSVDLVQFRGAGLADPAVHVLATRIRTEEDGTTDPNALAPQEVVISLADGTEHRWRGETLLGNPRRPLTREQHLAKFRRCWELAGLPAGTGAGETVISIIDGLESLTDLRSLTAALTAG